ncbi:MAG TPA: rhodanese-like domain-containing protein [Methylomirabilota bacterium]|nr:rhodanese-like domain-containing protein [Methylomirabilota bacterium]
MIFQQILNEEAGCLSYLIGCGQSGQAVVVDPARERVDEYLSMVRRKGLTITHIIDTHVHADHISGNQALAAKAGAPIHIHPAASAAFVHVPVEDGAEVKIGNVSLKVLHTPGHTPDSISLLVTDLSRGDEPWFVLTGDTLFVGDVGRPDFGGEQAAANLYRSLTERLMRLPDSVEVYPAHGAGSSCGRAMSSKTASTIGFERRFNPALQAPDVETFVQRLMTGLPPKPPNFDRIIARNRAQALPMIGEPRPLSAGQVREAAAKGACVLDVRSSEEYGQGHVPGAINVSIESPQFSTRVGWFVPAEVPVILVVASPTDLTRAVQGMSRIGLDAVAGYLQFGMAEWRSQGLPVGTVPQISVHDLATMREERPDLVVIDVREPFEWDEGHIEGALHLPMGEATRRKGEVPEGRPKAVLCAAGLRSSTVISAFSREGMTDWYNVIGGMTAWQKAGYPTVKAQEVHTPA